MWISPIYDRIQADVDLIKLDPTNTNNKGALNYDDLNRIESNCEFLKKLFESKAFVLRPIDITLKKDWNIIDIPSLGDINRIRNNIIKLINNTDIVGIFKEIEFSNTMDYIKVNNLEENLFLLKDIIESSQKVLKKCNTFFCGNKGLGIYV